MSSTRRRTLTGAVILTLVSLPAGSSEQSGDSLKDAARRQGGAAYDYLEVEMPFASLSQVVSAFG